MPPESENKPGEFALGQNYPNPFNPTTVISYQLPVISRVSLRIYNVLGQEVATLTDDNKQAGSYVVEWDGSKFPSGVYFYRLIATAINSGTRNQFTSTKKLLLIR